MLTAAKQGAFFASSDPCVFFPLAATGVYPKTRVWGSELENMHCFSATVSLRIELRWGCEESSGKNVVGSGVSFKYDPLGRRIYKSSSAGTSIYAYDGQNLIEETNATGSVVARYEQTQNIDEPLAMLRSSTTSYYHADGLGSVTSLSSAAGSIANTYTYDSFGKLTNSTGSVVNPFRYTAREFDTETNLYYYRARYYDPTTGRFLSEDPARFGAGINLYAYIGNSATNRTDPSGETFVDCLKALADLASATARVEIRVAEIVASGGDPDYGHQKALQQALNDLKDALDRVKKHCSCYIGAAALIAAAEAAFEAALPYLEFAVLAAA